MTWVDGVYLVSNSEVQTFKDCPRRWWVAWHRGLVPKRMPLTGVRSTGTRVHEALAAYYQPGHDRGDALTTLGESQRNDLDTVVRRQLDDDALDDMYLDNLELAALQRDFDLERAIVEGYLQWVEETGIDQHIEVVAPETYVEATFTIDNEDRAVLLIGKLDARIINTLTGRLTFIDHKVVGSLDDPILGLNQQVLHYMVIAWLTNQSLEFDLKTVDGALYNMLKRSKRTDRAKPPFYARITVEHNYHELYNYQKQLQGVAIRLLEVDHLLDIGADHHVVAPSRPSRDCAWKCDFFKICRMFDDGSRVEDAINDLYERRDPLSYYGDTLGRIDDGTSDR